MIPILIAICIVIVGLIFLWKQGSGEKRAHPTIPGPPLNSKEVADLDDNDMLSRLIFGKKLQQEYGPIVAFKKNDKLSVVLSSPELLKETRHLSSIPSFAVEAFRNILGDDSFAFIPNEEALERRKKYDQYFMMRACKTHFSVIKEVCEEFAEKLQKNPNKLPLMESIGNSSVKTILRTTFGDYFNDDDKLDSFKAELKTMNQYMGQTLKEGSPEYNKMNEAIDKIREVVKGIIKNRREEPSDQEQVLFIDILLDENLTEGERVSDGIGMFLASDTVNFIFGFVVYHLLLRKDVQEKIQEEIDNVLGEEGITQEKLSK